MAPPPEYDKEPKAPDKSATNTSCGESKVLHDLVNDQPTNSDNKPVNTIPSAEVENNKHVETLDDGQLRALLDEAITYKSPKDRAGKSSLFKELLEEVEQDEQACEAAARSVGAARGGGLPHSNSLQDLVAAALAAEPAPRRRHHAHAAPPSVSARALHGGSLPSGVDTSFLLGEEPARGAGYLATVRCVNPPPLAERRVSATDANCANDLDIINRRSKPAFPMTYTARATLEIGSGSVCSGRAVTTTTASNQVDSAIPFSCITTPEVVASCNTTSSTTQSTVAVDPKPLQLRCSYRAVDSLVGAPVESDTSSPRAEQEAAPIQQANPRSVISSSINGLPLSRPNGSTATTLQEEYKKSLDENGNSVQGFSSPMSGSSQHNKKPRRKKSSKNETVITSHQIDGYQGNKDLNEVLRFIESNAESTRANKLGRAKHKDDSDDKAGKKRSDRRKDKETKIKRATSMEELSRTRLCSLTDGASVSVSGRRGGADTTLPKPERRSWGDDARDPYYAYDDNATTATATATATAAPALHDNDFQTVTKKRKTRRRTDESSECAIGVGIGIGVGGLAGCGARGGGGNGGAGGRAASPRARRVSAPPSDRSNDSNDDMESVHSLPGDAARALPASYADIARTRHNIPDLIESCNYYGEVVGSVRGTGGGERGDRAGGAEGGGGGHHGGGGGAADADTYPALEPRRKPRQTKPAKPPPPRRERKERLVCGAEGVEGASEGAEGAGPGAAPAPDVLGGRPAVILLDAPAKPRDMDGVTFGFDINEQLLGGPSRRPRCDLVRDAMEGADDVVADADSADVDATATHTDVDVDADAVGIGTGSVVGTTVVGAAVRALRYLPPAPPPDSTHLLQIVDYVGTAWDDVLRCGAGKVRYYSE